MKPRVFVHLPTACCLVAICALTPFGESETAQTPAGEAVVTWDESRGLDGVEVAINGIRFRPLAGACPLNADLELAPEIPVRVELDVEGDVARFTLTSRHTESGGFDPGRVEGLRGWRRLDLSRYAEPYGQTWWQKANYSVEGDFWFTAHWVMEESEATRWKAVDHRNAGEGPFPAALRLVYEPDTAGHRLRLHDVLELRVSRHLWDVVPALRQRPSEYADFLQGAVFVDVWGGPTVTEVRGLLETLRAIGGGEITFYTILQNWECGGWDALLPDSVWMPDYPPNPAVGTIDELRALCSLGKSLGRFGFRTNYRVLREWSPSFLRGLAHYARAADGSRLPYVRPADWLSVAQRQDREIKRLFAPNAAFTDQMTSGAAPWLWHDWSAEDGSRSIRSTLKNQCELGQWMKAVFGGPLSSESLMDQHLLGEFVDAGDYAIQNGHARLFSPEFKLRRLHGHSGFHGMGLMYRFYEMPPFKRFHSGTTTFGSDQTQLDDYRACEVMFGNGGYLCYDFANWSYYLTEVLLIGRLQRCYASQPVRRVLYRHEGKWLSLEELVRDGVVPDVVPWHPQTQAFGLVRIEYEDGLTVVVNRLAEEWTLEDFPGGPLILPRYGWAVWRPDGSVRAYSAYWPGTRRRVDFLDDLRAGVRYLDPRGATIDGVDHITQWNRGRVVLTAVPDANAVTIAGRTLPLCPPSPRPCTSLRFDFDHDADGWRAMHGVVRSESRDGCWVLELVAPGAQLWSPPLQWPAESVAAIELRMSAPGSGSSAGLFFATDSAPNIAADKLVNFKVLPDGEFHLYRLEVRAHPRWRGTVTGLRLDPIRGARQGQVRIDWLRCVAR